MLIIAFGDVHMRTDRARDIPEIRKADCIVVTGDLTVRGGTKEVLPVLESLAALSQKVYAQIGNMDKKEVDELLSAREINLNGRGIRVGDVGLFGLGGSTPTPFGTPSEFSEAELDRRLWQAYEDVRALRFKVLFSHTPPFNTLVDRVRSGYHAGSRSVRKFLEQTDCSLCVCGHIHEAVGTDQVGSTLVLNPGMLSYGGYARIECDGETLKASLERS
jgi:hypothetical protein